VCRSRLRLRRCGAEVCDAAGASPFLAPPSLLLPSSPARAPRTRALGSPAGRRAAAQAARLCALATCVSRAWSTCGTWPGRSLFAQPSPTASRHPNSPSRKKERKTYARCQACVKGALASKSHNPPSQLRRHLFPCNPTPTGQPQPQPHPHPQPHSPRSRRSRGRRPAPAPPPRRPAAPPRPARPPPPRAGGTAAAPCAGTAQRGRSTAAARPQHGGGGVFRWGM
jgi:hypothetical protein